MFEGTITALVTPFKAVGKDSAEIDYDSLADLIEWQLDCGVSGFVMFGTTGESVTLSHEEKLQLLTWAVRAVKGRVPVIAGTGTNNTKATAELTREAKSIGADAALVVAPYYNKPTQEGLLKHYQTVATEGGLPIVIYNIPGRTGVDLSIETLRSLTKIKEIVALKEATSSADRIMAIGESLCTSLDVLSGEDGMTYFTMAAGGKGVISAAANVIPDRMVAITNAMKEGDFQAAFKAQLAALPIIRALFVETNPSPAKCALKLMNRIQSETVRLPLVTVREETRVLLGKVLGV